MAYGEIVEPEKVGKAIGDFVCGEAVTRAVELERSGKGSRVFVDQNIGGRRFTNISSGAFRSISSAIDFKTIDEFLWYASPEGNSRHEVPAKHILSVIDAALRLRYAPHFRWNSGSAEGLIQVGATIELMKMFADEFCKERGLTFPDFAFITADTYVMMAPSAWAAERTEQSYAAVGKLASDYRKNHFPKKKKQKRP
jgi:hypothetical protein